MLIRDLFASFFALMKKQYAYMGRLIIRSSDLESTMRFRVSVPKFLGSFHTNERIFHDNEESSHFITEGSISEELRSSHS